jgi:hypothetical protein
VEFVKKRIIHLFLLFYCDNIAENVHEVTVLDKFDSRLLAIVELLDDFISLFQLFRLNIFEVVIDHQTHAVSHFFYTLFISDILFKDHQNYLPASLVQNIPVVADNL